MVRGPHNQKHKVGKGHPGAPSAHWATSSYASRGRPQPQPPAHGQGKNTSSCQGKLERVEEVVSNIGWFSESLCFHIIL